jgi:hypothetical protein
VVGYSEAVRKLHYAATAINAEDISSALAKEAKRMEMDVDRIGSGDQAVRGTVFHARGTLGARELADVDPVKPAQPVDLASILAKASDTDLSAILQYAQQECNNESVTPENIESTKNYGDSDGDSTPNLDQIKALLSSLDPDLLQKLLVEILKE